MAEVLAPEVNLNAVADLLVKHAAEKRMLDCMNMIHSRKKPDEEMLEEVCRRSREAFLKQKIMVEIPAPTFIVGDLHGQLEDLKLMFHVCGEPWKQQYLFLGDYVDRGPHGIETAALLMTYKLLYPDMIFLLRGNHESSTVNKRYGFLDECTRKYSPKLFKLFNDAFCCMPLCAIVQGKILCMHGGISPKLTSWDILTRIERPLEIPDSGLICDLLWSDPNKKVKGWAPSRRGCSYEFGEEIVKMFCLEMHIDCIVRGHQVAKSGYNFFAERRLVTIFSAPNFCRKFDNTGAVMTVDKDLKCSFHTFEPKFCASFLP